MMLLHVCFHIFDTLYEVSLHSCQHLHPGHASNLHQKVNQQHHPRIMNNCSNIYVETYSSYIQYITIDCACWVHNMLPAKSSGTTHPSPAHTLPSLSCMDQSFRPRHLHQTRSRHPTRLHKYITLHCNRSK